VKEGKGKEGEGKGKGKGRDREMKRGLQGIKLNKYTYPK
jgi:hypothetical protein